MIKKMLALVALFALSLPSNAATLDVQGGQLVGVNDLDLNGSLYNVTFRASTCIAIWSGCDADADLDFQTSADALAAVNALAAAIDGSSYDDSPVLIAGITETFLGRIFVPYEVGNTINGGPRRFLQVARLLNFQTGNFPADQTDTGATNFSDNDYGSLGGGVWAQYDEITTVPVPAAVWLFGSAMLGLMGMARRKKA